MLREAFAPFWRSTSELELDGLGMGSLATRTFYFGFLSNMATWLLETVTVGGTFVWIDALSNFI